MSVCEGIGCQGPSVQITRSRACFSMIRPNFRESGFFMGVTFAPPLRVDPGLFRSLGLGTLDVTYDLPRDSMYLLFGHGRHDAFPG